MGKSGRVRLSDLRRAFQLIHDCRDNGHAPADWTGVLVEGLARLVDAQIVIFSQFSIGRPGALPGTANIADRGWPSPAARAFWQAFLQSEEAFSYAMTFRRFVALGGRLITRTREQLAGDDEWYGSTEFHECRRPIPSDDFMASYARLSGPPGFRGIQLSRDVGARRFGARERRLVRIFHHELLPHLGTTLVLAEDDLRKDLPPRLRRTLDCLLEGDSEKQAAFRLGVSRHTVHEYVMALYRLLGVQSRAELLALWLRRTSAGNPRRPRR